jgi:hypothetical protein
MRYIYLIACLVFHTQVLADTIGQYMIIADNISRMEMKADSESQAWVRSARNVLLLTSESIWESLSLANQSNTLFCMPQDEAMSAESMTDLIKGCYHHLQMGETEKNRLTVAQVGLMALQEKYPCKAAANSQPQITIQHRGSSPVQKMVQIGKIGALM